VLTQVIAGQMISKWTNRVKQIGLIEFIHLDKDLRDGKKRWTWTCPIENKKAWFIVLLAKRNGAIVVQGLSQFK
jgi:hypothetical protein